MAPRSIGAIIGMQLASRLSNKVDHRKLMGCGLLTLGFALYSMSYWPPDVPQGRMMATFVMQGFGIGFVFNPMTVMAFTTLPPALRGYATSLQALSRNIGQAVGVLVTSLMLVRNKQVSHADIAAGITPFDRVLQGEVPPLLLPLVMLSTSGVRLPRRRRGIERPAVQVAVIMDVAGLAGDTIQVVREQFEDSADRPLGAPGSG